MIRYVKIIIERNLDINWGNYKINDEVSKYNDDQINEIINELPCIDNDLNLSMIIDIKEHKIDNWNYNKSFKFKYNINNHAIYQILDENKNLLNEIEYDFIPEEIQKINCINSNSILYLNIDKYGNILN